MRTTILSLIFFLFLSNLLSAQTYKVGDEVVVIKKVKLRSNGKNADSVSPGLVLKVKDVDSKNNLWVGNGEPGWLQPVRYTNLIHDYGLLNALSEVPAVRVALNQAAQFLKHHLG
jgi:hypothetical protein